MKIECVLELMQEKDYIYMLEYSEEPMPLIYMIKNYRGKKFGKKLFKAIKDSEKYLVDQVTSDYSRIEIAKKSDIDEWLQQFENKEESRIYWSSIRLDIDIFNYLKEKGYKAKKLYNHLGITNLAIQKDRMKEEEAKNQEAIDLLDQLL